MSNSTIFGEMPARILETLNKRDRETAAMLAYELDISTFEAESHLAKLEAKGMIITTDNHWELVSNKATPSGSKPQRHKEKKATPLTEEESDAIRDSLSGLREGLLDLTARNSLLNTSFTKGKRFLHIVDELPKQIASQLLNGEEFEFSPIPAPSESEVNNAKAKNPEHTISPAEMAAKYHIDLSLELPHSAPKDPKANHQDDQLQSPYFPEELEKRLTNLKKTSDSFIQETGLNTLYLTIGFLEWYETKESGTVRRAPLFSIPVSLTKGELNKATQTYTYKLAWNGEDLSTNISLAKRLERDFDLILPDISSDDEGLIISVDRYLAKVSKTISTHYSHWKVANRASLSLLNFGKLLMYRDLDPQLWPDLVKKPLVRAAITGVADTTSSSHMYEPDYEIDNIEQLQKEYPIVDSADSSQHSAIIDAVDGKNLVIEGPPGTGKSQTITNLIAAILAKGKTVLFVSEKMAALTVVQSRLNKMGLGDFCLELHSHATQKLGVIESFKNRLEERKGAPSVTFERELQKNAEYVNSLNTHAELINSEWKKSQLRIFDILSKATQLKEALPAKLTAEISKLNYKGYITPVTLEQNELAVEQLSWSSAKVKAVCSDNKMDSHAWYGLHASELLPTDTARVAAVIEDWNLSITKLQQQLDAQAAFKAPENFKLSLAQTLKLKDFLSQLPDSDGISWPLLSALLRDENPQPLSELLAAHTMLEERLAYTEPALTFEQLASFEELENQYVFEQAQQLKINQQLKLEQFKGLEVELNEIESLGHSISSLIAEFEKASSEPLPQNLRTSHLTFNGLLEILKLSQFTQLNTKIEARFPELLDDGNIQHLETYKEARKNKNVTRRTLSNDFNLNELPTTEELVSIRQEFSTVNALKKIFSSSFKQAKTLLVRSLKGGASVLKNTDPLDYINALESYYEEIALLEQMVGAQPEAIKSYLKQQKPSAKVVGEMISWHQALKAEFNSEQANVFSDFAVSASGEWLLTCPSSDLTKITHFEKTKLSSHLEQFKQKAQSLSQYIDVQVISEDIQLPLSELTKDKAFKAYHSYISSLSVLRSHPFLTENLDLQTCQRYLTFLAKSKTQLTEFQDRVKQLASSAKDLELSTEPGELISTIGRIAETKKWHRGLLCHEEKGFQNAFNYTVHCLSEARDSKALSQLVEWVNKTSLASISEQAKQDFFAKNFDIKLLQWKKSTNESLDGLLAKNHSALEKIDELPAYSQHISNREDVGSRMGKKYADLVCDQDLSKDHAVSSAKLCVLISMIKSIYKTHPQLRKFQGFTQESYIKEFRKSNDQLLKLQRDTISASLASKAITTGTKGHRVSQLSERMLIEHECTKKKRHIPVRQLLNRAANAALELKPCFLMGPRSVSQYLTPEEIEFDVLIIDEASQLKPEEALGACARAKQIVVVGDSKQLPPTSFFDRVNNNDDDEDQIALSESESILDAARSANFPNRMLKWHYRSQHESLIAFSNSNFYSNHLQLFPSPAKQSKDVGIDFYHIEKGLFVEQKNELEALAIAERIEHLLSKDPNISMGVATMNKKQADLIDHYIETKAKNCVEFDRIIATNRSGSEPLFIKNLESVQGDERDVMIISCTYGRSSIGGPIYQRFGPINGADGWRRLNVLFTRSRKRMEIFSSLINSDIKITDTSSRGVKSFRDFLSYATNGLTSTQADTKPSEPSSFSMTMAEQLLNHGYDCDFHVGVSGFQIDVAVKHPNDPSSYILGILCDGPNYSSANSARDRDHIRNAILTQLGWKLERVWAPDWFQNIGGCIKPVLASIKQSIAQNTKPSATANWTPQFTPIVAESIKPTELFDTATKDTSSVSNRPTESSLSITSEETQEDIPEKSITIEEIEPELASEPIDESTQTKKLATKIDSTLELEYTQPVESLPLFAESKPETELPEPPTEPESQLISLQALSVSPPFKHPNKGKTDAEIEAEVIEALGFKPKHEGKDQAKETEENLETDSILEKFKGAALSTKFLQLSKASQGSLQRNRVESIKDAAAAYNSGKIRESRFGTKLPYELKQSMEALGSCIDPNSLEVSWPKYVEKFGNKITSLSFRAPEFESLHNEERSKDIGNLHFHKAQNPLREAGVQTLGDFLERLKDEIPSNLRNLGPKAFGEIAECVVSLSKSIDALGNINWEKYASLQGVTVIPEHSDSIEDLDPVNLIAKSVLQALEINEKPRDLTICKARIMKPSKSRPTLQAIADQFLITRERVRQIEAKALNRITKALNHGQYDQTKYRFKEQVGTMLQEAKNHFDAMGKSIWLDTQWDDELSQIWNCSTEGINNYRSLIAELLSFEETTHHEDATRMLLVKEELDIKERDRRITRAKTVVSTLRDLAIPILKHQLLEKLNQETNMELEDEELSRFLGFSLIIESNSFGEIQLPLSELRSSGSKYVRILHQKGKPMHFRAINTCITEALKDSRVGLSNPQHPLLEPIGKTGSWTLTNWNIETGSVADVAEHILQKADDFMMAENLEKEILLKRTCSKGSLATLLNAHPTRFFSPGTNIWGLLDWKDRDTRHSKLWTYERVYSLIEPLFEGSKATRLAFDSLRVKFEEASGYHTSKAAAILSAVPRLLIETEGEKRWSTLLPPGSEKDKKTRKSIEKGERWRIIIDWLAQYFSKSNYQTTTLSNVVNLLHSELHIPRESIYYVISNADEVETWEVEGTNSKVCSWKESPQEDNTITITAADKAKPADLQAAHSIAIQDATDNESTPITKEKNEPDTSEDFPEANSITEILHSLKHPTWKEELLRSFELLTPTNADFALVGAARTFDDSLATLVKLCSKTGKIPVDPATDNEKLQTRIDWAIRYRIFENKEEVHMLRRKRNRHSHAILDSAKVWKTAPLLFKHYSRYVKTIEDQLTKLLS